MRLRSLMIKGFKSFADETVLHFDKDVIGVVGPNGAGKSNVVDAIRWVLGEQKSKELRLSKMTDVIFNGTKKRKAGQSAAVTLTFENTKNILPTEYQNVSISRHLYRSGESEYRLNGVACRLKDIRSLFVDTGIGSNSYAIIALGMVDDILSDKENARRRMFEQAAGISKYKTRKKETLNKLKATTVDLDRIEDLLFEIEGQLKSLKSQARRTQKFFDLKEKYKELSIQYALISSQTLKEKFDATNKKLQEEKDKYLKLEVEIRTAEADLEKIKKDNLDNEQTLSNRQKKLNELVAAIRNKENEKSLLEQSIKYKTQSLSQLEKQIEEHQVITANYQTEIAKLMSSVTESQQVFNNHKQELDDAKSKLDSIRTEHSSAKNSHDDRERKRQEIERRIFDSEKAIAIFTNNLDNLKLELERSKVFFESRAVEYNQQKEQNEKLDQQIELVIKEIESIKTLESNRQEKLQNSRLEIEVLKEEKGRIARILDSKNNEYQLLKDMVESMEGFPESIKFLHSNWKKNALLLSDLLDVDEEYKTCIEQYLDPYLNYYVVKDLAEAKLAIDMLTKAQRGKANFFLLDELLGIKPTKSNMASAIPARDVITVDGRYQQLIDYLLQNVVVINEELDDLRHFSSSDDLVLLSKSGRFTRKRNLVSGGSVGLFEGKKIGRKKNLEKLKKLISSKENELTKIEDKLAKKQNDLKILQDNKHQGDLSIKQAEFNEYQRSKVQLDTQIQNYLRLQAEQNEKIKFAETQMDIASRGIVYNEDLTISLRADMKMVLSASDEENKIDELSVKLSVASEDYNTKNVSFIRQQNLLANIQRDLEFNQKRVSGANEKLAMDTIKVDRLSEEIKSAENKLVQLKENLLSEYDLRKEAENHLGQVEQGYYTARNLIIEKEEDLKVKNRVLNRLQLEVQNLRDEYTGLKFEINAVGDRLKIEFNVEIKSILEEEITTELSFEELQEKVEKLKNKLANFGEINPLAVEAFNEMSERYESISTQRDDIIIAKDSLLETIKEIEQTATKQFMKAFEQIRENFINVFRSLFTEDDNCNLILEDEDNPLESKIEIIAKPKGKKPKSLAQLSGGEKTLTATALLFALYLLKPAPFCIFDEVDAPLDDANIQKFNKIIKKFSKDSQFIIVTHNKSTMAAVDVLYGVYMQQQGVSGVSAVDFRNYEHEEVLKEVG